MQQIIYLKILNMQLIFYSLCNSFSVYERHEEKMNFFSDNCLKAYQMCLLLLTVWLCVTHFFPKSWTNRRSNSSKLSFLLVRAQVELAIVVLWTCATVFESKSGVFEIIRWATSDGEVSRGSSATSEDIIGVGLLGALNVILFFCNFI